MTFFWKTHDKIDILRLVPACSISGNSCLTAGTLCTVEIIAVVIISIIMMLFKGFPVDMDQQDSKIKSHSCHI